jgi:hypothetical protein
VVSQDERTQIIVFDEDGAYVGEVSGSDAEFGATFPLRTRESPDLLTLLSPAACTSGG